MLKRCVDLLKISLLAVLSALNYCIFVFPNRFAPAGIDGTIIIAFLKLNRDYAIKSTVFSPIASVAIRGIIYS